MTMRTPFKPQQYLFFAAILTGSRYVYAGKIDQYTEIHWLEQVQRFWSLTDPTVLHAVLGALFIGTSCGLLGSFVVVRRMALIGDTLAHAVLPGVALGFLWTQTKSPLAIFIGATIAALLGTVILSLLQQTTHIKKDSALAMVLSGFYAVGICILSLIQHSPTGNKTGIDKYLFGQAAAIGTDDLWLMGLCSALALAGITIFYKELLVTSFDRLFARTVGISSQVFHYGLMVMLTFTIVISLQAVGVVLVAAMLITPAATAYLLTDHLDRMLILAVAISVCSGILGIFASFLGNNLPTGPFMVISASSFFLLALAASPRHGIVFRWLRQRRQSHRIQVENTLKAIYHVMESNDFSNKITSAGALAYYCNTSLPTIEAELDVIRNAGYISLPQEPKASARMEEQSIQLTPQGWHKACEIVRNHRLWELYLTHSADYPADHVHEDAERIEHILGEATVRSLEQSLNYPKYDPHGKKIPSLADLDRMPQFSQHNETSAADNPSSPLA